LFQALVIINIENPTEKASLGETADTLSEAIFQVERNVMETLTFINREMENLLNVYKNRYPRGRAIINIFRKVLSPVIIEE